MKVSVEIITGTFIDTEVTENATVKELKHKISTDLKLPVNRLILVVGEEEKRRMVMGNEDEMMLRELGVREDSHMYLFFKHPDLVSDQEERSREGRDYASVEEISSEAESRRGNEEEEEEDNTMKNEEEDRDEKEKVEEEEKEKDMDGEGEKNGKEIQEDDRKEET